jgi:hypothetical protein
MASFQELRKGGRFLMTTKYSTSSTPVYVYPNKVYKDYIIVKYLSADHRGSQMGLDQYQINRGLCKFSKTSTDSLTKQPPTHNDNHGVDNWIRLRDTIILTGLNIILLIILVVVLSQSTNKVA